MLVALLIACGGWIDQDAGCGKSIYDWSDDLLAHILTGDGSGSFDYDPVDEPRTNIQGVYNASSGNFSYEIKYKDGYWLESGVVEGYGTAFHNGDLDIVYTETLTDKLGVEFQTGYRVERKGCNMATSYWTGTADMLEAGEVTSAFTELGEYASDTKYEWEAADSSYQWNGSLKDNLARELDGLALDGSAAVVSIQKPNGTVDRDWTQVCGDYNCVGTDTQAFNGDWSQVYQILDGETVVGDASFTFPYEGGGSGTIVSYEGNQTITCTYTYTGNACNYSCDNGQQGRCG